MATQIILTAEQYRALDDRHSIGPEGGAVEAKVNQGLHPMPLTDGTYALSPDALPAARIPQRDILESLPRRDVAHEEFQWVADAAKEQEGLK